MSLGPLPEILGLHLGWEQVHSWRAAPVAEAGEEHFRVNNELYGIADDLLTEGKPKEWFGEAAGAARERLRLIGDQMEQVLAEHSAVGRALTETADAVLVIERAVYDVEAYASSQGLAISAVWRSRRRAR